MEPDCLTYPCGHSAGKSKSRKKMTISARPIALFADFSPMRALGWMFAAAVVAAVVAPGTADAARRARVVRAGAYAGVWNVAFATTAGHCTATNRAPLTAPGPLP